MDTKNLALKIFFNAKDAATSVIEKVRNGLTGVSAETKRYGQTNRSAVGDTSSLASSLRGLAGQLGAVAAGYLSLNGLKSALESVLQTGGRFERLRIQIQSLMGGIAEGNSAVNWIKDFAKNTPLELDGVAKAFVKLKSFGLDPMDGTLQSLTDLTAKLGGGQEELEGIVLALGQAWSKQKLQAEEINQLVERGVPVWDLLAKVTGKNTAELSKLSQEGALGRDVIRGLIDEIGRSSQGSAAAMMSSWSGLVSNLQDTWSQFLDRIAQSGALDYFKRQIEDLLKTVEEMAASGELQKTAQAISDFFVGAAATVKDAIGFIRDYAAEFKALAAVIVGSKLANLVSAIGTGANAAAAGIGRLTAGMGSLANIVRTGVYGLLAAELFKIVSAYQQIQAIEANTANTQKDLENKTQALADKYRQLSEQLGITIQSMADLDKAVADGQIRFDEQTGAWQRTTQAMRDFDAEVAAAVDNQERIVGAFGKTITEMTNIGRAADDALGKFREWGGESGRNIENIASNLNRLSDVELQDIQQALTEAFDTGINRTGELDQALKAINTEQVTRAWSTLGEKSSQALEGAAKSAKDAYLVVKNSGTASAADLDKAWNAYLQKLAQVRTSLNQLSTEDQERKNRLAQIDQAGQSPGTPQQQSNDRYLQIVRQNSEFESALRQNDYQEAVRIAREKERLAADNAMADAQAAQSGEIASYKAFDSKQLYIKAIEDTRKALAGLSEQEKTRLEQQQAGEGQEDANPIDEQMQKITAIQTTMAQLNQPINLKITGNLDEINAKLDALLVKKAALESAANSTLEQNQIGMTKPSFANDLTLEVLKRGARR